VNALGVDEPPAGVFDAIAYIEKLRQSRDLSQMPVGHAWS